jgi:tRNA (guanine-N7-)-methyltransferase
VIADHLATSNPSEEEVSEPEQRTPLLAQLRTYKISTDFNPGFGLLDALYGGDGPIHLEIGAGGGEFCVEYARAQPNLRILGIERKLNYLLRGVRKARRTPTPNLVLVNGDALYLINQFLPLASVDAVHIYFPDPWPKKRHAKRRIFQTRSLQTILDRIREGGCLHIRTDVERYFNHATALLDSTPGLERFEPPQEIRCHQTNFERKFLARGLPIHATSYRLIGRVTVPELPDPELPE